MRRECSSYTQLYLISSCFCDRWWYLSFRPFWGYGLGHSSSSTNPGSPLVSWQPKVRRDRHNIWSITVPQTNRPTDSSAVWQFPLWSSCLGGSPSPVTFTPWLPLALIVACMFMSTGWSVMARWSTVDEPTSSLGFIHRWVWEGLLMGAYWLRLGCAHRGYTLPVTSSATRCYIVIGSTGLLIFPITDPTL